MLWTVILVPVMAGGAAALLPWRTLRRWWLLAGSAGHLLAVIGLWRIGPQRGTWIGTDEPGLLFLTITSAIFLAAAAYTVGYLGGRADPVTRDFEEGFLFRNEPDAIFVGCLLLFLAAMSLVCLSRHLGLLWVAIEATTLVSAPLIHFHRHHRSLEATWKYLLICSVGIALALLGNFFLAFAARGQAVHLSIDELLSHASTLDPMWLKAAFILFLVGYGTKMGLAPMHTWLPDAHSESPSMVSALLSGALLNCAFLGILRGHTVLGAAGLQGFSGGLLVLFGLLSMGFAAVFLIRQTDFKRMLAYSSVEHMGILALGVGLGGLAAAGSMLHAVNHSLAKGMLFLVAGNLLAAYGTKIASDVRGALQRRPITGCLWIAGFLAIVGSPPFGLFISELTILRGALEGGRWVVATVYLLTLGVIFAAMARIVLPMAFGQADADVPSSDRKEAAWSVAPPLAMAAASLVLGLYVPVSFWDFLQSVASRIGVH
ncbi:MAG: NADH dehydrogenase FAD-containing subunit [Phycisphaerae bacterium]|nr:NADH dehydrogenase FAD-containing subunit [Phycisphaerae bacterium]